MLTSHFSDTFARDHLPPQSAWPDFVFTRPEYQYPQRLNAVQVLLDERIARSDGNHIALRNHQAACSYEQLFVRVNQIANVLVHQLGLQPGNRVLLRGANHPMMAACWLAVVKAGLIAVPTMPLLRAKELIEVINKAKVSAALCDRALQNEMQLSQPGCLTLRTTLYFNDFINPKDSGDLVNTGSASDSLERRLADQSVQFEAFDTAADDVALIAFTSGTTGQPKGTMHFHRDLLAMCDAFPRHVLQPTANDVFCGTPPLAFTFGLGGMLCFPMSVGAATVLIERLTPAELLKTVAQHRATILFTAPTFYRQMALQAKEHDLSSLTKCVSAGEALPEATRRLWRDTTGLEIIDGIGATEMMHIFISSAGSEVRAGAIGKVVPGYEAKIVDEQMRTLAAHTVGRLAVRGPTGCRYLADERQQHYVKNGWNLPGDTFLMDDDGYFYYQARSDDMIISAGYNIAGPEVESALLTHDAVAECAVIGVADDERGQIVKAFVVLKADRPASAALGLELQNHVKAAIAPYKYPRQIEFLSALPRTETGKLQRFRLRTPG